MARTLGGLLRQAPRAIRGTTPIALLSQLAGGVDSAVGREQALQVSAVFASVALISRTIAALPVHVYRRTAAGGREMVRDASTQFLWGRPNPETTRTEFWEGATAHLVLHGNAYIYVASVTGANGRRRPVELWPIDPARVAVIGRDSRGRVVYRVDGQEEQLAWGNGGDILHIRGLSLDGIVGVSPLALAAHSITVALQATRAAGQILGSGGIPSGVLTVADRISDEEAQRIAAEFERRHGGRRSVLVLNREATWKPVAISPDDLQAIETRRFEVADIARVFGVPPEMIGAASEGQSLTYANVQDRLIQFVQLTLQPWIARIEQALSDELLAAPQYVKFDLRGMLRGNSEQRVNYYRALAELGVLTINEIRELEDMEPLDGGDRPPRG